MQQWNCWSKRMISIHVLLCFWRRKLSDRVFVSAERLAENSFSLLNWSSFSLGCAHLCGCSLQENAIGNKGVTFLANALKGNTSLRTLWFVFFHNSTKLILTTFTINDSAYMLPVVFCRLWSLQGVSAGTSGAVALAEALTSNQTLQTLEWVQIKKTEFSCIVIQRLTVLKEPDLFSANCQHEIVFKSYFHIVLSFIKIVLCISCLSAAACAPLSIVSACVETAWGCREPRLWLTHWKQTEAWNHSSKSLLIPQNVSTQSEWELSTAKEREEGGRLTYLISVKNKSTLPCVRHVSQCVSEVQQQIQQEMLGFRGETIPDIDTALINLSSASSACRRILWVWMAPYSSPQPLRKTTSWPI